MATSRWFQNTYVLISICLPFISWAQTVKKEKPPIDASKNLKVVYGSSSWNNDSSQVDTAHLYVKDSESGKIAKILLEESAPDSSTFSGTFSMGWASAKDVKPEVYIPPEAARRDRKTDERFLRLVQAGKVHRKPVVFKRDNETGMQLMDVYDTREQAKDALSVYKEQIKLEHAEKSLVKSTASESEIEAARLAEKQALINKLALEAVNREIERKRQEQIERQRVETERKKAEQLAQAEKERRKRKAQEIADLAIQEYQKANFKEAEKLFSQSTQLDPNNKSHYFMYGVTLYRNEKYNEALVTLGNAEEAPANRFEKIYYMALSHYRLKEVELALMRFREAKEAKDKFIAPSSAFYEGLILFQKEEYEPARAPFEYVIDNSQDPKLDERAEEYLEKISRVLMFKKNQAKRWLGTITLGAQHDSNILLAADGVESQGSSIDGGGLRVLTVASGEYRPVYNRSNEFSAKVSTVYIYSLDSEFTEADPWLNNVSLPYTWKGVVGKKTGYKLSVAPGYETINMNLDETGAPENILNSALFNVDGTLVMSDRWFSNYIIDIRQDDSTISSSVGDDDADALKYALKTNQTTFFDKAKKQALIAKLGLILNDAKGSEKKYTRYDIGFVYARPFAKWEASWNAGINYYKLNYSESEAGRTDDNYNLSLGLSKPENPWLTWGVMAGYTKNDSTSSSNAYNKYTVMSTVTFKLDAIGETAR